MPNDSWIVSVIFRRYYETHFFDLVSVGRPVKLDGVLEPISYGILPITLKIITLQ